MSGVGGETLPTSFYVRDGNTIAGPYADIESAHFECTLEGLPCICIEVTDRTASAFIDFVVSTGASVVPGISRLALAAAGHTEDL